MNIYDIKLKVRHDMCWSTLSNDYNLDVRINAVLYYPFDSKLVTTAIINANNKMFKEFINDFEKSYP